MEAPALRPALRGRSPEEEASEASLFDHTHALLLVLADLNERLLGGIFGVVGVADRRQPGGFPSMTEQFFTVSTTT